MRLIFLSQLNDQALRTLKLNKVSEVPDFINIIDLKKCETLPYHLLLVLQD